MPSTLKDVENEIRRVFRGSGFKIVQPPYRDPEAYGTGIAIERGEVFADDDERDYSVRVYHSRDFAGEIVRREPQGEAVRWQARGLENAFASPVQAALWTAAHAPKWIDS